MKTSVLFVAGERDYMFFPTRPKRGRSAAAVIASGQSSARAFLLKRRRGRRLKPKAGVFEKSAGFCYNVGMRKIILLLIKIYQKTVSPDHGWFPVLALLGRCRHQPTCSQYTREQVARHGALKGLWRGLKRIATCY